jgi:hypothetical protein
VLTRSIEIDAFDLTIEEKFFRAAKRVCVIFAVAAVTLGALDLANIRTIENAAGFIHENGIRLADIPDHIRTGIDRLSLGSDETVTVAIPRGEIVAKSRPAPAVAGKRNSSAVSELAAIRHLDAIEFAMEAPLVAVKSAARISADPESVSALRKGPIQLASAGPGSMPASEISPPSLTVSLPMSSAIPLDMVPMPRPAPGVPPPSPAERLHLEGKEYAKAERCLANAIYFEARSEPLRGQMAVAQVVINRAFSGFYPNDICGVVYQNAHRHLSCQFTFACDGKSKAINERGAWARANRIAKQSLAGQIYVPEVAKSTHYHAVYVHPNWVREMKKMVRYGIHNFYRPYAWGAGDSDPAWGSGAMAEKKK